MNQLRVSEGESLLSATHPVAARWPLVMVFLLASQWASAADTPPIIDFDQVNPRPNFSGAWEKDFSRSDDWQTELERQIDLLRRSQQQDGRYNDNAAISVGSSARGSASNLVDMARLAEFISRQTNMQISQNAMEVRIQREGDADLVCGTKSEVMETFSSVFGTEVCGWDQDQLVFRIRLPDGVLVSHRFDLSAGSNELNMATAISRAGSNPFTLIQFFRRYDAPSDGYTCIATLTRGNSCSQAESGNEP